MMLDMNMQLLETWCGVSKEFSEGIPPTWVTQHSQEIHVLILTWINSNFF